MNPQHKPARLVVLLSGNGSTYEFIQQAINSGELPAQVVCVISNRPNAFGLTRAIQHKIPNIVLDHTQFVDRKSFDQALAAMITKQQPDWILLAGFMRILTPWLVKQFDGRLINIHPSLLPKYPGLHTHQQALDAGDTEHGSSVHFVTAELDAGPVIEQARVSVLPGDSASELEQRVKALEGPLYVRALNMLCSTQHNRC